MSLALTGRTGWAEFGANEARRGGGGAMTRRAIHIQGRAYKRRCTYKAVHTQGGAHKRRSVAIVGVLLFKGGSGGVRCIQRSEL